MICLCPGYGCDDALPFYYDLAFGGQSEEVPNQVVEHLGTCRHCQEQIERLVQALADVDETAESEDADGASLTAHLLSHHFSYCDTEVSCLEAKPFLPTLVDPTLRIRVQTPITSHVDICPDCQADMKTLASLQLNSHQLFRFGQFLADHRDVPAENVKALSDCLTESLLWAPDRLTSQQRKEICRVKELRSQWYRQRAEHLHKLRQLVIDSEVSCPESVTATEVFDWVFPYGATFDAVHGLVHSQAERDHVQTCPHCLDRFQHLHLQLFGIADRPASAIVTMYTHDEAEQSAVDASLRASVEPQVQVYRTKRPRLLGSFLQAAAAMIVVVIGVFFLTRSPQAIAVSQDAMREALLAVDRVHVQRYDAQGNQPFEELWFDRTRERILIERVNQVVLWDMQAAQRTIVEPATKLRRQEAVSPDQLRLVYSPLQSHVGLLPHDLQNIPGIKWDELDEHARGELAEYKAHRLEWSEPGPADVVLRHQIVYYVHEKNHLPARIEQYEPDMATGEPVLRTIIDVDYPTAEELDMALTPYLVTP